MSRGASRNEQNTIDLALCGFRALALGLSLFEGEVVNSFVVSGRSIVEGGVSTTGVVLCLNALAGVGDVESMSGAYPAAAVARIPRSRCGCLISCRSQRITASSSADLLAALRRDRSAEPDRETPVRLAGNALLRPSTRHLRDSRVAP